MKLEYDGTDFAGFQFQSGQRTVQAEVERALERITGLPARVHGAGRTDAGVHALGQVVSFETRTTVPTDRLPIALNSRMDRDVRAVAASEASEGFHARFSAVSRTYVYVVLNRKHPSALFGRYSHHVPWPLDVDAMREASRSLLGEQDFAAWANRSTEVHSTVRRLELLQIKRAGAFVLLRLRANAFLHGMVRNVAGTLLEVGTGKRRTEEMAEITKSRRREMAGPCAPARGLCLVKVGYPNEGNEA